MTNTHPNLPFAQSHFAHAWEYADAAARTGASGFVAGDVGKLARQLDDNSFWVLTATTPSWVKVSGAGSGEANTASNTGTSGTGLYKQKSGIDLEFYKLAGVANRLSVALDGTDKVDLDMEDLVKWASSPATDQTAYGIYIEGTSGDSNAAKGDPMCIEAASGNWNRADADDEDAMPAISLALDAGSGGSKRFLIHGFYRDDSWSWTKGKQIYVSDSIGNLTQTHPVGEVQAVGFAITDKIILWSPVPSAAFGTIRDENESEQTTTQDTFQDSGVSLALTPGTWRMNWFTLLEKSGAPTTYRATVRLYNVTDAVAVGDEQEIMAEQYYQPKCDLNFEIVLTSTKTYRLEWKTSSASSTAKIKQTRMWAQRTAW